MDSKILASVWGRILFDSRLSFSMVLFTSDIRKCRLQLLLCVAAPGCISRILIFTHPGSRISDPGSKNSNKREWWKKIFCHTFLCSDKFHKIVNYFSFEMLNFQRAIELFTQKIVTKLSKIRVWDPGSEIRKKPILDPRSRGQKGTGSRIRIRNTVNNSNLCDSGTLGKEQF